MPFNAYDLGVAYQDGRSE